MTNSDSQISGVISLNPSFYTVFKQDKCPKLDFKRLFICLCLRSFVRCQENTDKMLSVHYFSPECAKITKGLMVDLTIKFKQQIEFQGRKIVQD